MKREADRILAKTEVCITWVMFCNVSNWARTELTRVEELLSNTSSQSLLACSTTRWLSIVQAAVMQTVVKTLT